MSTDKTHFSKLYNRQKPQCTRAVPKVCGHGLISFFLEYSMIRSTYFYEMKYKGIKYSNSTSVTYCDTKRVTVVMTTQDSGTPNTSKFDQVEK